MPRMKFRIQPISIALLVTLVSGGLSSDDACAQKELTKIKIGYAAPTVDNVLIAVADKKGLFEKFGLKAELIGMRCRVQMLQGLVGGSTDFGQVTVVRVLILYSNFFQIQARPFYFPLALRQSTAQAEEMKEEALRVL